VDHRLAGLGVTESTWPISPLKTAVVVVGGLHHAVALVEGGAAAAGGGFDALQRGSASAGRRDGLSNCFIASLSASTPRSPRRIGSAPGCRGGDRGGICAGWLAHQRFDGVEDLEGVLAVDKIKVRLAPSSGRLQVGHQALVDRWALVTMAQAGLAEDLGQRPPGSRPRQQVAQDVAGADGGS